MAEFDTGGPSNSGAGSSVSSPRVSLALTTRNNLYPNPFLDVASVTLPKRIKGIFTFAAVVVLNDGIISQCVSKMSEYPITNIKYEKKDEDNSEDSAELKGDQFIKFWRDLYEKKLKIKSQLITHGMNYYSFGNSLVSIHYPFRRELICPVCKFHNHAKGDNYRFKNLKFYAKCKGQKDGPNGKNIRCHFEGQMKAIDVDLKTTEGIRLVMWDLMNIDIKYNSITGNHTYLYQIPKHVMARIRIGDRDYLEDTRLIFIEAIRKNRKIKLDPNNLFHFKRPAPQYLIPQERGWGVPLIVPSMKDYFHYQILRKGNEMIAFDHMVPLRILFPQGTGDVSPHQMANLGNWRSNVESEIFKWRQDQNYISIMPIPMGIETFSGNARLLMTTQELKVTEDRMIIGSGMQPEIIRGGATWSGGNVSLRITENHFLTHRMYLEEFMQWIGDNISAYLKKPGVKTTFTSFKMADDVQMKQLMVNLNQQEGSRKKISDDTLLADFGIDNMKEYKKIQDEIRLLAGIEKKYQLTNAEIQGRVQYILNMFGAESQMEGVRLQQKSEKDISSEMAEEKMMMDDQASKAAKGELRRVVGKKETKGGIELSHLINDFTIQFAQLGRMDPEMQKEKLFLLKQSMPNLFSVVFENLKEMNLMGFELTPELMTEFQDPKTGMSQVPTATQGGTSPQQLPGSGEKQKANKSTLTNIKSNPQQKPPRGPAGGPAASQVKIDKSKIEPAKKK